MTIRPAARTSQVQEQGGQGCVLTQGHKVAFVVQFARFGGQANAWKPVHKSGVISCQDEHVDLACTYMNRAGKEGQSRSLLGHLL